MSDNDSFRLIDPDEAVSLGCFLIFLAALKFGVDEKPAPQPQAKAPVVRDCPVTVSQYGPGERWYSSSYSPVPACAGAVVPAPSHILSMPVSQ